MPQKDTDETANSADFDLTATQFAWAYLSENQVGKIVVRNLITCIRISVDFKNNTIRCSGKVAKKYQIS